MRSRKVVRCEGCGLPIAPVSLCLCAELTSIDTRTRVHLVMHRHETFKTSGTGRLALKMLSHSSYNVRGEASEVPSGARLVLFPTPNARVLAANAKCNVLVVPDGSWAQARRIAQRDPAAREAEAVSLPELPTSRYGLRRNPREGTVCTLEAIAHALAILEGPSVAKPLLDALDRFVERMRFLRGQRFVTFRPVLAPRSRVKLSSNEA